MHSFSTLVPEYSDSLISNPFVGLHLNPHDKG